MGVMVKDLTKRVLVALWGGPLILGLSYLGDFYFLVLLLIINGFSLWEFYTITRHKGKFPYRLLAVVLSSIVLISAQWFDWEVTMNIFLLAIFILLLRHLKITPPETSLNSMVTIAGMAYISLFLVTLIEFRQNFSFWQNTIGDVYSGGKFMVLLWASIWVCDTFAYFGGRLFGKHKLAPVTSPNKTIEGAVFGLFGGIIIFVIFGPLWIPGIAAKMFWLSGLVVGVFGQIGDLVESRFKRDAGVKDTSTLLPGHGGFFDRFDSIIFVSPIFYLLFYSIRP
jgi:phosphatidate cytidylyltransferase